MALAPGLRSFVRIVVVGTDTAAAMGSGDVPVLGTPRLLALAEAAAVAAIGPSTSNQGAPRRTRPTAEAEIQSKGGDV